MAVSDHSHHLHRRRRRYPCGLLMPPLHPSGLSLVRSLITLAHQIVDAHKRCLFQHRNLLLFSRRVQILLMLLEGVRDAASALPPSALLCFSELHVLLQGAKLLSEDCAESSRICLLIEHRNLSESFHRITQEIAAALDILPLALLDVSGDVREQVELLRQQARKATLYVDAEEARLCAELRSVMEEIEKKETPHVSRLQEIFHALELRNAIDCQRELQRLEGEDLEGAWDVRLTSCKTEGRKVPLSDLVSFVRYCKCVLYGATEFSYATPYSDAVHIAHELDQTCNIPDEFRCPISLQLMMDPVTVATGQTYERIEITRWIDGNNQTCPKSGLSLPHTTLIPNYALRNLIRHWCVQHNISWPPCAPVPASSGGVSHFSRTALQATRLTVEFLLQQLPRASLDTQRHIAGELRQLAKCGSDNHKVIGDAGAIPLLIPLLSAAAAARTAEHAVTTLLSISTHAPNKARMLDARALDPLLQLLERNDNVTEAARDSAVAVLCSLLQDKEAAMRMGRKPKAVEGLLQLLRSGSPRGKHDAASALFHMALTYQPNFAALAEGGTVQEMMSVLLSIDKGGMEEEGLALLAKLAKSHNGRSAMAESTPLVPLLVDSLRVGRPESKENAVAILFCLCRYQHSVRVKVQSMYGVLPLLQSLLYHGTPRARRKSASLLGILLR